MALHCVVCETADAKYKCPVCASRYCSVPCYKAHKTTHPAADTSSVPSIPARPQPQPSDVSSAKPTVALPDFSSFETDQDLHRLFARFPSLKYQLQLVYGLTLRPSGEEAASWSRQDWLGDSRSTMLANSGGRSRGRGARDRRQGRAGGARHHGRHAFQPEERSTGSDLRGPWTQEKGDKQGADMIRRMQDSDDSQLAEGMREFVRLCQMKFGRGD